MLKATIAALAITAVSGTAIAADTYMIDGSHTSVGFSVKHMVISKVKGKFNDFQGTIMYDEANPEMSKVTVVIKTASIDTANEDRDNHLKGDEFLNAEKHPDIKFESSTVMKKGEGWIAVGNLSINGVTKEVELPFQINGIINDPWGNTRMGAEASLKINRHDFGVKWSKKLDNGGLVVGDTINIEIELEAVKKKA